MNAIFDKIDNKVRYGRISEVLFDARAMAHKPRSPKLAGADARWVDELRSSGGITTSLDELDLPITEEFRRAVDEVLPTLPDRAAHQRAVADSALDPLLGRNTALHCISLGPKELVSRYPALVRFGLEERILDIVEGYLGLAPAFTALSLRKDVGGDHQVGTRFWHLDTEDVKVIRMMVYLNDVGLDDGPFEFIPRPDTEAVTELRERAFRSAGDPIFDDEMRRHIPESKWKPITGPAGTVLLADNALCYHHGKVHDSERIVLIFTYTSRHPRYPKLVHNAAFDSLLTERQRSCMFLEMT